MQFLFIETNKRLKKGIRFLRQLGYSPILFTRMNELNPRYYKNSELFDFEDVYDVETHSTDAMLQEISRQKLKIRGIVCCHEDMSLSAGLLAKKLNLTKENAQTILVWA